jgi:hypothetical protein
MRRMRNASMWRESLRASNTNNTVTSTTTSRRVSFAPVPDNDNNDQQGRSSEPEEDVNNIDNKLLPVQEEEMAELAPTDAEAPRAAHNFTASELRLEQALTEDVYSLMYTAPVFSTAFAFACGAFTIQFIILLMICKSPQRC